MFPFQHISRVCVGWSVISISFAWVIRRASVIRKVVNDKPNAVIIKLLFEYISWVEDTEVII